MLFGFHLPSYLYFTKRAGFKKVAKNLLWNQQLASQNLYDFFKKMIAPENNEPRVYPT